MSKAGAIRAGKVFVEIFAEDSRLIRGLQRSQRRIRAWGTMVARVGAGMTGAAAAFALPFWKTVRAAADAEETVTKFGAVFRDEADAAAQFADRYAKQVGRSALDLRDSLSSFQGFWVGLGFDPGKARGMSELLAELTVDFASFHNVSDEEGLQRFISALSGSSEVVTRFGINLKEGALNQELLAMGFKTIAQGAGEQEKALARLNLIHRAMSQQGAIGDATRTAGSFVNQLKRLKSMAREAAVAVGRALIPALEPYVRLLGDAANWVVIFADRNAELFQWLVKVAGMVAVAGAVLMAAGIAATVMSVALGGLAKLLSLAGGAFRFLASAAGLGLRALMLVVRVLGMGVGVLVHMIGRALMAAVTAVVTLVTSGFSAMVAAIASVMTPIGVLGIALAGILAVGVAASGVLGAAWAHLKDMAVNLAKTAVAAFGGIRDALAAGDLALAGRVAMLGLKVEFERGALALNSVWQQGKVFFLDVWSEATGTLARLFINAWAAVRSSWVQTMSFLGDAWAVFNRGLLTGWRTTQNAISKGFTRLMGLFDEDVDVEGTIGLLDEDFRKAQQRTDRDTNRGLMDSEALREQQLAEVESDRVGSIDAQREQQEADAAGRRAAAEASVSGSEAALAAAQKEFNGALAEAAAGREAAWADAGEGGDGSSLADKLKAALAGLKAGSDSGLKVAGSFNATAAARGFGAVGPEKKIAKATEDTAKNTKNIAQTLAGMEQLAFA